VADRRTAAEAAARASMRWPMLIRSRATNERTAPTREGKVLRPNRGTLFQGRIARNRPQTGEDFREPQKITTMRFKFGVHPGNVGVDDGVSF